MTQYEKDGERRSGLSLTQRRCTFPSMTLDSISDKPAGSIEVLSYPKTQADGEQTQQEAEQMAASA